MLSLESVCGDDHALSVCREHPICLPVSSLKSGQRAKDTHRRDESRQRERAEANSQRTQGLCAVQKTEVAGVSEQPRLPKMDFFN